MAIFGQPVGEPLHMVLLTIGARETIIHRQKHPREDANHRVFPLVVDTPLAMGGPQALMAPATTTVAGG